MEEQIEMKEMRARDNKRVLSDLQISGETVQ